MKNIFWTLKLSVKSRPFFIMFVFLSYVLLYLLSPISTLLISSTINKAAAAKAFTYPLVIMVVAYILSISFENIQFSFSMLFIENIENSLAKKIQGGFFEAANWIKLSDLDDPKFLRKMYRARNITWYVLSNIINNIFHAFGTMFGVVASGFLICRKEPILLLPIILISVLTNILSAKKSNEQIVKNKKMDEINRTMQYDMSLLIGKENLKEIRSYGAYKIIFDKWKNKYIKSFKTQFQYAKRWAIIDTITQSIALLFDNLILFLLTYWVLKGNINIGTLVLIVSNKSILMSGLDTIISTWIDLADDDSYLKDLREVLSRNDSFVLDKPEAEYILEMSHVGFSYFPEQKTIDNVVLNIKKGQVIALVGENGSGKSTLAKIAIGLLKADCGVVKIDTADTSGAYQDFAKFELSLRENIGFGDIKELQNNKQIILAIKKGDSEDVLNKSSGALETILGKSFDINGIELSGGQWQRIAISRSFMGSHGFIVFDEPAASLDALAEMRQLERIRKQLYNMGGLIISHRVGIARMADYILFMDNGKIAAEGTHEELFESSPEYKRFFMAQAQWYREEELT